MDVIRCPFLGMQDDPDTRLDFPSPGNVCHKASPTGPIDPAYQQRACLTAQHVRCQVYTAKGAVPLPASIQAGAAVGAARRPAMAIRLAAIPLALILLALLAWAVFSRASLPNIPGENLAGSGGASQERTPSGLFGLPRTGADRNTITPNATNVRILTKCPPPDGWMTYTVNPTDSLYRLSVIFEISVADLQLANCMGDETVILPGDLIYLPFMPTLTPTVTPTLARQIPASTFTTPPEDVIPVPQDPPTAVPPTFAPTTPTLPPPTQTPIIILSPTPVVPTVRPTAALTLAPTAMPTIAPTIAPTVAPTQTPPLPTAIPEPTEADGDKNGRNETIDCGGGVVTVSGNNNNVTLQGVCLGLIVRGNNNHVTIPAGTPVTDLGNNNVIVEG